jgi:hypothetical protein
MKRINLTLTDGADIHAVAARARAAGMQVEQALGTIGVLVGQIDESQLERLRSLAEVASVELDRKVGPADR